MDLLHLAAVAAAVTAIVIGVLLVTTVIVWPATTILGVLAILAGAVWLDATLPGTRGRIGV